MTSHPQIIDLNPHHLREVQDILARHVPDCEVRAFGSRATWSAHDGSDLDLAIVSEKPLHGGVISRLKDAFQDSDLPITVDVLDWHNISESFHEEIEHDYVVLKEAKHLLTGEWQKVALGDIVHLQLSSVDKKSNPNERDVRLCNYTDVYYNSFIHSDLNFMSATATGREIEKCSIRVNDVIITKDSEKYDDIGVPALVRENVRDLICGYHLAILRPDLQRVDGVYLYYALNSREAQGQFHSYANGVTRFGLRKDDIKRVEIFLPSLKVQRGIAHILATLDDKIELNRRMNETLEEMARALFKSWFVDFDPVRAKMDGRWRPGESLPGLPAELYGLFPDRLVDSELGPIPQGWQVKTLGECFRLTMGQSPPSSSYNQNGEGLPFFQGKTDFGFRYPENRKFCTAPRRTALAGDTLVSVRAPVGEINMAWEKCCVGRGVAAVRHMSGYPFFTYYAITALQPRIQEYEHTGTVFGAITKKQLAALPLVEPPREPIDCFREHALLLDSQIREITRQTHTLSAVRDTLLPKLVSGQLRLGGMETFGA